MDDDELKQETIPPRPQKRELRARRMHYPSRKNAAAHESACWDGGRDLDGSR